MLNSLMRFHIIIIIGIIIIINILHILDVIIDTVLTVQLIIAAK